MLKKMMAVGRIKDPICFQKKKSNNEIVLLMKPSRLKIQRTKYNKVKKPTRCIVMINNHFISFKFLVIFFIIIMDEIFSLLKG